MTRWLLLRGLTREAAHWGDFPALLRGRSGDAVCCVDLPGSGTRRHERSPASVRGIAQAVLAALPPHEGRTVVLALSLGGMVAVEACRLQPGRLAGCVLVNTSGGGASCVHERLQPRAWPGLARILLAQSRMEREARVLAATSAQPQRHADRLPLWTRIAAQRPVRIGHALRQAWAAARYRAPDAAPAPTLLLASRGDALVSPRCSRALASRWRVPLREHPWAGHDLPLDDPDWLIDEALAWSRTLRR